MLSIVDCAVFPFTHSRLLRCVGDVTVLFMLAAVPSRLWKSFISVFESMKGLLCWRSSKQYKVHFVSSS